MNTPNKKKYFAFISYNSRDTSWGKRLQRKLERYRMPTTLCSERGWKRKPINPVWFAPTDIQPGGLDEELKARLRDSGNLIVICSPASAQSKWVGKEISFFHELGRDKNIHFFIVDGIPNSFDPATECFNPVVRQLGIPEILGANIHEKNYRWPWLNRERAYVQLISKLLGVEFDSIWRRHRRRLFTKALVWTAGILVVLAAMLLLWTKGQPFDANVKLNESSVHNSNLPPLQDALVSICLDNEIKTDTISSEGDFAVFKNMPHRFLGKEARITFSCPDFLPVDTIIKLQEKNTINIRRNPDVYGNISTTIFDFRHGRPVPGAKVIIDRYETQSDSEGNIKIFVPLEHQRSKYTVRIPQFNTSDTITMPTNEYHTIGI